MEEGRARNQEALAPAGSPAASGSGGPGLAACLAASTADLTTASGPEGSEAAALVSGSEAEAAALLSSSEAAALMSSSAAAPENVQLAVWSNGVDGVKRSRLDPNTQMTDDVR